MDFTLEDAIKIIEDGTRDHTFRVNEVEGLFRQYGGTQVVAFRGTEFDKFFSGWGWRDVLRDLRAIPWYDKRVGWSHAGFLKGARGAVDRGLFGFLRKSEPVVLLGHSLGGALAINAAAMLKNTGFNVESVTTFGAPRTLTKSARKKYIKLRIPTSQYTNRGDPIPDIPCRWWGYRHVNEVKTGRPPNGYSILRNHMLAHYREAISC